MGQVWRITFDTLHSLEAEEDGIFSDGDQAVLAVIAFVGELGKRDTVKVWRTPLNGADWPSTFVAGDAIGVPANVGVITFPRIDASPSPGGGGPPINILGAAVIAIEHDNTPLSFIGELLDGAVNALRGQLLHWIGDAKIDLFDPAVRRRQLETAAAAVAAATRRTGFDAISAWIGSGFDPDDASDPVVSVFSNFPGVAQELSDGRPILLDLRYVKIIESTLPGDPFPSPDSVPILPVIAFPGGSFHYQLTGRVMLVEEDPEFVPDATDAQCRPLAWEVVPLPTLVEAVKRGETQVQVEIRLDDMVHGPRTAYGTGLRYEPGRDEPGSYPFTPPGHYGEKLTMIAVECVNGRRAAPQWKASILLGADPPFGGAGYSSAVIIIDDVHVYHQPLAEVGSVWEGSDPSSHIRVISRRYRPPH
jgi:hypothetical protein